MKRRFFTRAALTGILILCSAFISCNNPTNSDTGTIPTKWQGKYKALSGYGFGSASDYINVGTDSATYYVSGSSGTISNLSVKSGGSVSKNSTKVGEWLYVYQGSKKIGYAMSDGTGDIVGIGADAPLLNVYIVLATGYKLSPTPDFSGVSTNTAFEFAGGK